jgi:3alpha(or 20beta)-hydroxysteroid dehydrogenase
VIDTNLKGQFLAMRAVAPSLARAGGGAIVNIAFNQGHVGTTMFSAYVCSKWAVRGLTMTAAAELARDGIRVNSISPGVVRTPLITEPVAPGEKPAIENVVLAPSPCRARQSRTRSRGWSSSSLPTMPP